MQIVSRGSRRKVLDPGRPQRIGIRSDERIRVGIADRHDGGAGNRGHHNLAALPGGGDASAGHASSAADAPAAAVIGRLDREIERPGRGGRSGDGTGRGV